MQLSLTKAFHLAAKLVASPFSPPAITGVFPPNKLQMKAFKAGVGLLELGGIKLARRAGLGSIKLARRGGARRYKASQAGRG